MAEQVTKQQLAPIGSGGQISEETFRRLSALVAGEMIKNPNMAPVIKSAFDIFTNAFYQPEAKLTAQQQMNISNANIGLKYVDEIERLSKSRGTLIASVLPFGAGSPEAQQYETISGELADVIGRLRTGAQMNEEEIRFYRDQLPKPWDTQERIDTKIQLFRDRFGATINQQGAGEIATQQPQAQSYGLPSIGGGL